ncbi:hypothetical protein JXL21_14860 [Candidatus Bathyarchaeota archaeon]|nr:hypothetical protein [Candidatus Bathyarchaeota archaeon]
MENRNNDPDMSEEDELEVKEYLIPKTAVNALADSFRLLRNRLNEVLDLPPAQDAKQATGWWQSQSGDDQITLRAALTAIASPSQITNITVMRGNNQIVSTTLAQESMRPDDPCFLIGEDASGQNLRVRRLRSPDVMSNTILMYLDAAMELGEAEFHFTTELDDFHTLLGVLDLHRRKHYQALMEHEPLSSEMKTEDILRCIDDAHTYGDPRWLLPFALPSMPDMQVPDRNTLNHSLYDLGKAGIISISGDYSTVTLAEPSELLAAEMLNRVTSIRVTTLGFTESGAPASQTSLLIRGENLVWYVNVGGDTGGTATWAAVSLDQAGALLKEMFTPVGAPETVAPTQPKRSEAPSAASKAPLCPKCGKPATWVEQYRRWYCYSCSEYLPE